MAVQLNSTNRQTDTKLSDLGKKQADLVGLHLQDTHFTHMFSSDLARAAETARFIMKNNLASSCTLTLDTRLRERSFGALEGKTLPDLKLAISQSGSSFDTFSSEGAESMTEVVSRAKSFLNDLFKVMAEYEPPSRIESLNVVTSNNSISQSTSSHDTLIPPSSRQSALSLADSKGVSSLHSPLHLDIPSLTSLIGFHNDAQPAGPTTVSQSPSSLHASVSNFLVVNDHQDNAIGTELDVSISNILVVSHGLLLKELTRLILSHHQGKLDSHTVKEMSKICHNTGVSKYLIQSSLVNGKVEARCLKCLVINDTSHLSFIGQDLVTQFQGAA